MKQTKSILGILLLFLITAQNSFAISKPIPGVGIVVKKNPGSGAIKITTGSDGGFSAQLQEGEYELSISQEQLQSSVNGIIKSNYPNSSYRYNGSGIQIVVESEATAYKSKAADGRTYSIVITVPKGGATLSGKMIWDDSVMKNQEISCPDGYEMRNGECVPIANSGNQQSTERKTKGKVVAPGPKSPMLTAISCPDGFVIFNGECVPIANSGNQNARAEGKLKGKIIKPGENGMLTAISCPDGFVMSNGECMPIVAAISKPIPGVGIVVKSNKPFINVSLSGNMGSSASDSISKRSSFNPNLGFEIIWKNFGIGLDAGTFSSKPHFDFDGYAAPLQNLDFIKITNTNSNWTSTYFLVGPQYSLNLKLGATKFVLTTSIKGGLTINAAPNFSITDNSTPQTNIAKYSIPADYKKNVFTVKPSITFTYWFNENFAANINAQYIMQQGQTEFTILYTDLSKVQLNSDSQKAKEQINAAPKVKTTTKGPDKYMSFGLGLTYSFRKGWDGSIKGGSKIQEENGSTNESLRKGITENGLKKNEVATDATAQKGWDGSVKGGKIETIQELKPPYSPTNPNERNGTVTQKGKENISEENGSTNESSRKGINENGLKKNEADTNTDVSAKKGWDGSVKGSVNRSSDVPETDSDGTTVYVMTFCGGCKRACTVPWTTNSNGDSTCSGEQTNMSCNVILIKNNTATARINVQNIVYDKDGNIVVTPTNESLKKVIRENGVGQSNNPYNK